MVGPRPVATATLARDDWMLAAACRTKPPAWWELASGHSYGLSVDNKLAVGICRGCPVKVQCGAATHPADEGVIRAGYAIRDRGEAKAIAEAARQAGAIAPVWEEPRHGPDVQPCGTYAAYRRHLAASEKPCEPCRRAANTYSRNRYPTDKPRGART